MDNAEMLIERIKSSENLSDFHFCSAVSEEVIPFPIEGCFVDYSIEKEAEDFLLGDEDGLFSEIICFTVRTNESAGAAGCREAAKRLCMELTSVDEERSIISAAAEKCEFETDTLSYMIKIRMELRPTRICGRR